MPKNDIVHWVVFEGFGVKEKLKKKKCIAKPYITLGAVHKLCQRPGGGGLVKTDDG